MSAICEGNPTAQEAFPYLQELNTVQRDAVETLDGPLLVLAGAGTGKTKVLTTRIAHLMQTQRAFPGQILAVTFTNKASKEMQARVMRSMPYPVDGMWLGTFHSTAAKILRRHAELIGLTSDFTIANMDDQLRLVKQLARTRNIDDKSFPAKALLSTIQRWKDLGLTPEKISSSDVTTELHRQARTLYGEYQHRLLSLNSVDFGDLLLNNLSIFSQHPDVLRSYQQRFRYVLVDEYQDTNISQYLWLRLLVQQHQNICCVGDDDQSIYGWRGAEVGNILRFEEDFPTAKVVRLEQNYRSQAPILAAASGLIAHNNLRLGKTLWTDDKQGDRITLTALLDEREEARHIANTIQVLDRQENVPLSNMAVLVRAGFQTRAFEECFMNRGVPYRVVGGLRFYERMEIRDIIAYMRLIVSPSDDLAFERIINVPRRGIGKTSVQQIQQTAAELGTSCIGAATRMIEQGTLRGKAKTSMKEFLAQLARWQNLLEHQSYVEVVDIMLKESGYVEMWKQENSVEAEGRVENIQELLPALQEFSSISEFLEHVSLVTDGDNIQDGNMVSVMTLHAAKGLEFDTVFLPGWEEGVFPHQKSLDEKGTKGLEEERRLAYVGITRAKKRVFISHVSSRRVYHQWQQSIPSRFIEEIPAEYLHKVNAYQSPVGAPRMSASALPKAKPQITKPANTGGFEAGARVQHATFGEGYIRTAQGQCMTVQFDTAGTKKVMDRFLTLCN